VPIFPLDNVTTSPDKNEEGLSGPLDEFIGHKHGRFQDPVNSCEERLLGNYYLDDTFINVSKILSIPVKNDYWVTIIWMTLS
jgi:hypothetical protein